MRNRVFGPQSTFDAASRRESGPTGVIPAGPGDSLLNRVPIDILDFESPCFLGRFDDDPQKVQDFKGDTRLMMHRRTNSPQNQGRIDILRIA
ncbi:MAG: hypothetical protein AAGE65_06415 [Planctomycetota bacterium]